MMAENPARVLTHHGLKSFTLRQFPPACILVFWGAIYEALPVANHEQGRAHFRFESVPMADAPERGATKQMLVLVFLALVGGVVIGQLGGTVELTPESALRNTVPAPEFAGQIETTPRAEFLSYARSLAFNHSEGAGDTQRLTVLDLMAVPPAPVPGPLCRIEPLQAAADLERDELAAGRVVARIINRDTTPFPELALGPGDTTYWWVDSAATGQWRTLLISSEDSMVITPRGLALVSSFEDGATRWGQALARWRWRGQDEGLWVTCTATSACLVE